MYLSNEIDSLCKRLKADDSLNAFKIIKAYPYNIKPTRLSYQVIAVSPSSIEAESIAVDNEDFYGKYSIDLDVFSPYEMGSPAMSDALERVLVSATDNTVVGISVSAVTVDENAHCFKAKCTLKYCYSHMLRGINNEL